jgi:hypothetical protein
MRNLLTLMVLLCCACVSGEPATPVHAVVPVGAGDDVVAAEYQRSFRAGYDSGRRGRMVTACLFGSDFEDPVKVAWSRGWHAGQEEGWNIWLEEYEEAVLAKDRERLIALFERADDAVSAEEIHRQVEDILRREESLRAQRTR